MNHRFIENRVFQAVAAPVVVLAVLAVLAGFSHAAAAQGRAVDIAAFYGQWTGSGVSESEISLYFRLTTRDLDVEVRPAGAGFEIAWTTVQRQRGDPTNPTPERKATVIRFAPTGRPNIWRAVDSSDPLIDERYAWARIKEQTFTVHTLAINGEGGYDMQIYQRTLTPFGMKLEFVAFRDGEERRSASGRLVKVGN